MHDVAVIGAGPGGSAAAHYLAQRGLDVLLLDKSGFPRDKTCGDGLTPRAVAVLQDMGLVDELKRVGHIIRRFEVFSPNGKSTHDVITVRDGGLLFLVVRREAEYEREFEDALTDLDAEIACDEEFDLIRLSVLALPHCPPEAMQSFLGDDNVTLGFQVDGE